MVRATSSLPPTSQSSTRSSVSHAAMNANCCLLRQRPNNGNLYHDNGTFLLRSNSQHTAVTSSFDSIGRRSSPRSSCPQLTAVTSRCLSEERLLSILNNTAALCLYGWNEQIRPCIARHAITARVGYPRANKFKLFMGFG